MSDTAIRVEHLSKRYRIGGPQAQYKTIRETMMDLAVAPVRRLRRLGQPMPQEEIIWALKDVSFEVKQGEVVGIIGRNGAGKTTLLKILSRITEPTEGQAEINGRVGSLLEVGTGFHPELTGRENIYLNGAILGMKRVEIDRKFDEIVAFSEIEKFIDTPVKRYSSGMYVRLAFSVAAHLEPEILLVDEVLAVGDAAFQKKCLGKVGDVAREGRTVFFVSHNMRAVVQLCSDCIWLHEGRIIERGKPTKVVPDYLAFGQPECSDGIISAEMHMQEPLGLRFTRVSMIDEHGHPTSRIFFGTALHIQCEFDITQPSDGVRLGMTVQKLDGTLVSASHHTDDVSQKLLELEPGGYVADMVVQVPLVPGGYTVDLFAKPDPGFWGSGEQSLDWVHRALMFHVEEISRDDVTAFPTGAVVLPASRWSVSRLDHLSR